MWGLRTRSRAVLRVPARGAKPSVPLRHHLSAKTELGAVVAERGVCTYEVLRMFEVSCAVTRISFREFASRVISGSKSTGRSMPHARLGRGS